MYSDGGEVEPTIRLPTPDPDFRLTAEERAGIRPGFDVDALERLLAAVEPGARPILLEDFLPVAPGAPGTALVRMGDPALQPLLDEVWAPVYELYPDLLDEEEERYPGRALALQRRKEKTEES